MIRNYFIIALRSLWRNKLITGINLVGMAIGFGIFITLWAWVQYDLKFDKFHEDIDQMYLLNVNISMNGTEYTSQRTGGIYSELLAQEFPQVLSACRVSEAQEFELGVERSDGGEELIMRYFDEDEILAVDSSFLDFFSFPLLYGNKELIFSERDHIVITESLAMKLFDTEDALDKTVRVGEGAYFKVVGIVEDPPEESSYQFQALMGFHIMEEQGYPTNGYGGTIYFNNFKIDPQADLISLSKAIDDLVLENFDSDLEARYFLDSFSRLHLHGEDKGILGFYLNLIMSLVILSIACINFINLTTAYSAGRIKEIFIRKSAGASKTQLITQFMGETYLLLLFSFYLGLFIAEHLLPEITRSFGVTLQSGLTGFKFWWQFGLVFLITGLLAGLYPAVKIVGSVAGAFSGSSSGNKLQGKSRSRKVLIVLQFTFSLIFIVFSIFVIRQYSFLKEADLGFNREDVIYIRTKGKAWELYPLIKRDLESLHFVKTVSSGSAVPVMVDHGEIDWGEREGDHNKLARILWADPGFLETFDIDLLEGAFFSEESDTLNYNYVVVNQSLVDLMEWEDPVGRTFYMWGQDLQILGVTQNINFFPFNLDVFGSEALIYRYDPVREYIFTRVQPGTSPEQVARIVDVFQNHNPGYEVDFDYVSDFKIEMQESAEGVKLMFKVFSGLAIFIAIMGLIGLSVFNNTRRTKEVGIRKSMGASTGTIMKLLLFEFIRLVIISNLIAMPAAYYLLFKGFQMFTYSVELKIMTFLGVFILSLLFSLMVVSFHALRTARANPVDSLRYE